MPFYMKVQRIVAQDNSRAATSLVASFSSAGFILFI
jgi:hypothetical protein